MRCEPRPESLNETAISIPRFAADTSSPPRASPIPGGNGSSVPRQFHDIPGIHNPIFMYSTNRRSGELDVPLEAATVENEEIDAYVSARLVSCGTCIRSAPGPVHGARNEDPLDGSRGEYPCRPRSMGSSIPLLFWMSHRPSVF